MTIEIDTYGFMLDTEWAYVALSWQLLITSALLITAYKIYKRMKNGAPIGFIREENN
jgi:hypothetical protein